MEEKKYPYIFKEFEEDGDKYRIVIGKDDYECLEGTEHYYTFDVDVINFNSMGEEVWVRVDYDTPGGHRDTIRYLLRLLGAFPKDDSVIPEV